MLKYLFTAEYTDGSVFVQNPEDRSQIEPEKRSAYYDIDHSKLVKFSLQGEGHIYSVNLHTGHFEVDSVPFYMHEENLGGFKLIFFRRHTHQYNQETKEELGHSIVYQIGWQCFVNGKNYQKVMNIS